MSENIDDYLKDGETPLDAIKRERRSTDNLLRHLADAKQRIEDLVQQCEKLRAERNAVRVKVEQPLLLRIRKLERALTEVLGLVPQPPVNKGTPWQVRKANALLNPSWEHSDVRKRLEPPR